MLIRLYRKAGHSFSQNALKIRQLFRAGVKEPIPNVWAISQLPFLCSWMLHFQMEQKMSQGIMCVLSMPVIPFYLSPMSSTKKANTINYKFQCK